MTGTAFPQPKPASPHGTVPVPCKVCGAPMREVPTEDHLAPVHIVCEYCNASETLPADPSQRVVALRTRLAQIKWLKDSADRSSQAMSQLFESGYLPLLCIFVLLMVAFQVYTGYQSAEHTFSQIATLDEASRAQVLDSFQPIQGFGIGAQLGVLIGVFVVFGIYRTSIRKKLFARAPLKPGFSLRCRQCGGDLPKTATAFVHCVYCKSQNLVTTEIAKNQASLIEQELAQYRVRAAEEQKNIQHLGHRMMKIYYVSFGVGILIGIGLGNLLNYLLKYYLLP